jgi:hypothetical protein
LLPGSRCRFLPGGGRRLLPAAVAGSWFAGSCAAAVAEPRRENGSVEKTVATDNPKHAAIRSASQPPAALTAMPAGAYVETPHYVETKYA